MFLHLSHDEKFIDAAREAFERAAPRRNEFIVVDAAGPLRYIKTFEPRRMPISALLDRAFLALLPRYDAIFLHSLNRPNRLVVDAAPDDARFVWLGWGYDYYQLICAPEELLLPRTQSLVRSMRNSSKLGGLAALVKTAITTPDRIRAWLRSRRVGPGGPDESAMLGKITYFSPVLPTEDALVRRRHPDFQPRYASWNYGVHDIVNAVPAPTADERVRRVVLGNNATPEYNHLDTFGMLAAFDGDILCPLSYGGAPAYRDAVVHTGVVELGVRFKPLTDYITARDYATLIAASSHLVMNHLRQQGMTNVLIALQAGTRVVMQRKSPLYPYLLGLGLQIDDIAHGLDPMPLADDVIARNRQIVSDAFGPETHHRRTCKFLSEVSRPWDTTCIP
jgi:hypothetical protein